jgi:ribosomal protein S18 acetylase RimI-like enzyme
VSDIRLPAGCQLVTLARHHPRKAFASGVPQVDDWLHTKALQQQEKHLSVSKVLLDATGVIVGYYTIAPGQVAYGDLPESLVKKLPKRSLPIAVIAWLGVDRSQRGQGLGTRLLALSLRDCYEAGQTFPFVAVIIDSLDDAAKRFFEKFDFQEVPGNPYRLYLSVARLEAMMARGT